MIAEASLVGFIKTLFIILLIIYGLRLLMRFALPYMMNSFAKKVEKSFYEQYGNKQQQNPTSTTKTQQPKAKKKVGEYIDYEEID